MTSELEATFRDLGISQYLDSFVDQGFDTWDTILDIQESDLNALGVKLGHRRKLQRRIANARGIAPSISLSSPKPDAEGGKRDDTRSGPGRGEANGDGTGVAKRKYRRHPKPDENAPERPPSAYVLFSNKMREDLKGHNLTFTEIAKLVGENWQSLPPTEKEAYESQASSAKEKYQRDLVEYKKTPEWRKYAQYLQEFKENQAKPNPDANKRPKIEPARLRHGSTSSSAATGGNTSSGSGSASTRDSRSSSERMQGSEPPPTRQERVNSVVDATESHPSLAGDATMSYPIDESRLSPRTAGFDLNGGRDSSIRNMPLRDGGGIAMGGKGARQHLPSLSNMLDDGRRPNPPAPAADSNPYTRSGFVPEGAQPPVPDRLRVIPPAVRGPMLCHDESSTGGSGSGSSGSPVGGFGPSLGDGPLPIHALLSNRAVPQPAEPRNDQSSSPPFVNSGEPTLGGGAHNPRGYGFQSAPSALQHMKIEESNSGDVVMTSPSLSTAPATPKAGSKSGLDGMSALLRAGEIVDRQSGE